LEHTSCLHNLHAAVAGWYQGKSLAGQQVVVKGPVTSLMVVPGKGDDP